MVEKFFEFFLSACANSQKHKLAIPHQIFRFYENNFYWMLKVGVFAALNHRVAW